MLTVHKFEIELTDYFTVTMRKGAKVIHVAEQRGMPYMWVLLDTDQPAEEFRFRLAGTGHPIEETMIELHPCGSFMLHGGALVFHLFMIR